MPTIIAITPSKVMGHHHHFHHPSTSSGGRKRYHTGRRQTEGGILSWVFLSRDGAGNKRQQEATKQASPASVAKQSFPGGLIESD